MLINTSTKHASDAMIDKHGERNVGWMRVSLGDTSAHGSLHLPADLCRSVSHSTLDTARRRGIVRCRVPPPGRPVRTDTPLAITLGISGSPRFLSREEAKFV